MISHGHMEKTTLYQDQIFRRIVVGSTGLGLTCMLGSAASIRISKVAGLEFVWHWSILLVATAVVLWNWRFWNLLWRVQQGESETTKRQLMLHLGILLLL